MTSKSEEGLLTVVFDGKSYSSYYRYDEGSVTVDCGDGRKSVAAYDEPPLLVARQLMRELIDRGLCEMD